MPKLERKGQKVFGETGPEEQFGKIGSGNSGNPSTTKDIEDMQTLEQFDNGYFDIVSTGLGKLPYSEDFNSLFHLSTRQIAYIMQAGVAEWHSGTRYYAGVSIVQYNGELYIALKGDDDTIENINHIPPTSSQDTYWKRLIDPHPIGTAYIQFPGFPAPDAMGMLGLWERGPNEVSGQFIRFEGSGSAGFGSGQTDQFQDHNVYIPGGQGGHTHSMYSSGNHSHYIDRGNGFESDATSYIAARGARDPRSIETKYSGEHTHIIRSASLGSMSSSGYVSTSLGGTPRAGSETRPSNRTVRLWRRTA